MAPHDLLQVSRKPQAVTGHTMNNGKAGKVMAMGKAGKGQKAAMPAAMPKKAKAGKAKATKMK
jgi:hypothetical protein